MTHVLQQQWFDPAVEQSYVASITAQIQNGDLDAAQARLLADIEDIGSTLAPLCASLPGKIRIDGWDDLIETIEEYEGDPISAVHLMLMNPADLTFEDRDRVFEPELGIALYSDTYYAFSKADRDTLFAESELPDRDWFGQGEDIEVYVDMMGMGALNTALLRHKRQYHFRDQMHALDAMNGEDPDLVPLLYIEFVMCALYRAVLFHQAVKARVECDGLPGNIPVIAGMDNMKIEVSTVYMPKARVPRSGGKPAADLVIPIKRMVQLPEFPEVQPKLTLRQAINAEPEEKPGFFRRLFGFGSRAA
jgi:hypothetical protein